MSERVEKEKSKCYNHINYKIEYKGILRKISEEEGVVPEMISKELKNLSRRELVDIIYQMKKNEQQMQEEIDSLKEALQEKRIRVSAAGSIAEAAADITRIFSAAQMTADLYLSEIENMKAETEKECAKMIGEAKKKAGEIFPEGEKQAVDPNVWDQTDYEELQLLKERVKELQQETKDESCEG